MGEISIIIRHSIIINRILMGQMEYLEHTVYET